MTMMQTCRLAAWLVAALLMNTLPAHAGSMEAIPVRLQIPAGARVVTMRVRNQGNSEIVAQLSAHAWRQENGADVLEQTKILAAVPGMVRLAPGAEQVVRVGVMAAVPSDRESTFRILVREIPPVDQKGVGMALQLSVPVFTGPPEPPKPPLDWEISDRRKQGVWVRVTNRGDSHAQVSSVSLKAGTAATKSMNMRYVLPGSTMEWRLDGVAAGLSLAPTVALSAETDRGSYEATVAVGR